MNWNKQWWIALGLAAVGTATLHASPYEGIPLRNPFGLVPKAPIVETNELPEKPTASAALTLNGIADFSARKWALLTSVEAGKPTRSFTLTEGQTGEGLEVLAIDGKASSVKVRQQGIEVTLTFPRHGDGDREENARRHVQASQRFVDEHTRAHTEREKREALRREQERAQAAEQLLRTARRGN